MGERTVNVGVGKGYEVVIGAALLQNCGELLASVAEPGNVVIVTDSNVAELYLDVTEKSLAAAGFRPASFIFPFGEKSKSMETLNYALEFFAASRLTRSDLVVALGGGVTGDLAGFAAAIYQRGVRFAQLPTTLLAAVDSSVGGKTAVNLKAGKNLAGAYKQPEIVICDTDCLKTLPEAEMQNGLAEAIKYGVLCDRALFDLLSGGITEACIPEVTEACVKHKSAYVQRDEKDNGDRRFLNLGHTIGHAVEKCSGLTVSHGRAVAAGMAMIALAGEKLGLTEPGTAAEIGKALKINGLPVTADYCTAELFSAALSDKKREGDEITLVIPRRIGECFLHTVPVGELEKIIGLGRMV
ncbi:MAG: 3-dehydroquinate synthase [Clostridia bacterium]|nr:3-dehydroquinate synthase [Clostridia bacterium]